MRPLRDHVEIGTIEEQHQGLTDLCKFLSNNINMNEVVEVGSWLGASACILSDWFKLVHCVDHWEGSKEVPDVYDKFIINTKDIKNIIPIRLYSIQASKIFKDESLDFVYIDGDHRYEYVKNDILVWLPKVKKGGAIGGHDYGRTDKPNGFDFTGLTRAVNEIVGEPTKIFSDTSWVVLKI